MNCSIANLFLESNHPQQEYIPTSAMHHFVAEVSAIRDVEVMYTEVGSEWGAGNIGEYVPWRECEN